MKSTLLISICILTSIIFDSNPQLVWTEKIENNDDLEKKLNIDVWPNPFVNQLNIYNPKNHSLSLIIKDNEGNELKNIQIEGPNKSILTDDLKKGNYILQLSTNKISTQKLIRKF